jgi:hypothetical protein
MLELLQGGGAPQGQSFDDLLRAGLWSRGKEETKHENFTQQ